MADTPAGTWGTLSFEIPDFLDSIRKTINDVAQLLITLLDIALTILNFAKAFLIGFLDPLSILVQAIIDQVKSLLDDLRQVGIYLTGDWGLIGDPDDLIGGFAEYENRMIARLTDRTDETRPQVSSQSTVLGIFFYLSVDLTEVNRLVNFIKQIVRFFNLSFFPEPSQPGAVIRDIKYGNSAASILSFTTLDTAFSLDATPPNLARVTWGAIPSSFKHPFNPFPQRPPGGFLVTVSTIPDGIKLMIDRPVGSQDKEKGKDDDTKVQPRETIPCRTLSGQPVVLYGGAEALEFPKATLGYNSAVDGNGNVKDGRTRVFGVLNPSENGVVALEDLKDGDTYYFQRTFVVPFGSTVAQWATGEYGTNLELEDMPNHADLKVNSDGTVTLTDQGKAPVYYVRIASCDKNIGDGTVKFQYDFSTAGTLRDAAGQPFLVPFVEGVEEGSISAWSETRRLTFPNAFTNEYLETIEAALAVLVLTRSDLVNIDEIEQTLGTAYATKVKNNEAVIPNITLKRTGLEHIKHLIGVMYEDFRADVLARGGDPREFRKELRNRVKQLALDLYNKTGPMPDLEKFVTESTTTLRTVKWTEILQASGEDSSIIDFIKPRAEMTLVESLDPSHVGGGVEDFGIARNPFSLDLPEDVSEELFWIPGLIRQRGPHFSEVMAGAVGGTVGALNPDFKVVSEATAEEATAILDQSPALRVFYEKYIQEDGSLLVPSDNRLYLDQLKGAERVEGSADMSPVFFVGRQHLEGISRADSTEVLSKSVGVMYCRSLLAEYNGGVLVREAAIALGVAASSFRRPLADGEWVAIRLFDSIPGMENFFDAILNWVETLKNSLQSIIDTIKRYIEFLEARVVELQQLLRRINAMLQSILGFSFQIPKCSALILASTGTDGLLADLISAQGKPSDSPLAYGGGVAAVLPIGPLPAVAVDLVKAIFKPGPEGSSQGEGNLGPTAPIGAAAGLEALPPAVTPTPDPEPDVL